MITLINGILALLIVVIGIIGLVYLQQTRQKMGKKIRNTPIYLSIAVILFIITGISVALFPFNGHYTQNITAGLLLIGILIFTLGCKTLADAFR